MNIRVKKLLLEAKIPERAHPTDAGLDLFSCEEVAFFPGERKAVKTGIALAVPSGYVGLVWDKSGVSLSSGMKTLGGVIDAGYRGEVLVIMANLGSETYSIHIGQKIAQLLVQEVLLDDVVESEELGDTDRGEGSFGSTGR